MHKNWVGRIIVVVILGLLPLGLAACNSSSAYRAPAVNRTEILETLYWFATQTAIADGYSPAFAASATPSPVITPGTVQSATVPPVSPTHSPAIISTCVQSTTVPPASPIPVSGALATPPAGTLDGFGGRDLVFLILGALLALLITNLGRALNLLRRSDKDNL